MDDITRIENYLGAISYDASGMQHATVRRGKYPFITISREAGAGGHSLAEILLQKMALDGSHLFQDWQVLDVELCQKILEIENLKVSFEALLTEDYHSEIEDVVQGLLAGYAPQSQVTVEIFNIIRKLATLGKLIIVGRGGACLTSKLPLGLHVRLVASPQTRLQRMMELLNLPEPQARKEMERRDNARVKL